MTFAPAFALAQVPDVSLPLTVVVSLDRQLLVVFEGDKAIGESAISSGKPGHTTPSGIFSILEKRPTHFSNIYDNAPMPFMQRLTWSGIALHGSGHVPSYPASHGCVRLPHGFAEELFSITQRGAHVIVANAPVWPKRLHHATLVQPGEADLMTSSIRGTRDGTQLENTIQIADASNGMIANDATPAPDEAPLRLLITRRTMGDAVREAQAMLNDLGFDAGMVDGISGRQTISALNAFRAANGLDETGRVTPQDVDLLHRASGRGPIPNGHLYARRKFEPLFDVPVHINDDHIALGTHLFSVAGIERGFAHWVAISLSGANAETEPSQNDQDESAIIDVAARDQALLDAADDGFAQARSALDRIVIDPTTRQRIAGLLTLGSSIAISDHGIGPETGRGTDFIVITRG